METMSDFAAAMLPVFFAALGLVALSLGVLGGDY